MKLSAGYFHEDAGPTKDIKRERGGRGGRTGADDRSEKDTCDGSAKSNLSMDTTDALAIQILVHAQQNARR